jgi:hypothetical protein
MVPMLLFLYSGVHYAILPAAAARALGAAACE